MARLKIRTIPLTLFLSLACAGQLVAQDAPKLRVINGREAVTPNPSIESLRIQHVDTVNTDLVQAALSLPVQTLSKPVQMSEKKKKELAAQVDRILKEKTLKSAKVGIQILDLESGDIVYELNSGKALKPASNTKLLTTAAALEILGPDYQFESRATSKAKIEKGVLKGNLQLHINHDFTWSTRFYNSADIPLHGIIAELKRQGIQKIAGKVILSGYVVYGGTPTATLSCNNHLKQAGRQFGVLLKRSGISFEGLSYQQTAKSEGAVLATWVSPVLSEAIVPLNRVSHNEYADMLLMALGAKNGKNSSFEEGSKVVSAWLKSQGIDLKGFVMQDGSGLSHGNHMSPAFINALTQHMLKSSNAREWAASMSISGYDGTYGGRLVTDDAKGRVCAKSGTLRDTIAGSGFFVNAQDGRTYAFSIIINEVRQKAPTRQAIDRIVRVFLGDNYGTKRPKSPEMLAFTKNTNGQVSAAWAPVDGVSHYRIYESLDGNRWQAYTESSQTSLILPDAARDIRITAVNKDGAESDPSLIFSYRPGAERYVVLDEARCQSDADMRPLNRVFAHERPLASFIPPKYGVETLRRASDLPKNPKGILWHDVACNGKFSYDANALKSVIEAKTPVIVNLTDAHLNPVNAECKPSIGKILGCFGAPVIAMDRRMGKLSENLRLRKAAGSGSTRPAEVKCWSEDAACVKMGSTCVAACSSAEKTEKIALIGFDIQALDGAKSLHAMWQQTVAWDVFE